MIALATVTRAVPVSMELEALAQRIAQWARRPGWHGPGSPAARQAATAWAMEVAAMGQREAEAEASLRPVLTPRQRLRRTLRRLAYALRGWA